MIYKIQNNYLRRAALIFVVPCVFLVILFAGVAQFLYNSILAVYDTLKNTFYQARSVFYSLSDGVKIQWKKR
jgi:hypothetical protein